MTSEEKMDYATQNHTAKRDEEFNDLKKASKEQKSYEPFRNRFNTMFEELTEFKDKAQKRKKELETAEQKYRDLERMFEGCLANQTRIKSKSEENATSLDLPFKLDVIKGAHKTGDTLIIGDEQCTTNNAFFEHYYVAIGAELGKGGFGTVYTATVSPKRKHALKVYILKISLTLIYLQIISKSKFAEKADNKRSVQNEVSIQMNLEHENILSLQYCVQDKDHVYLLMEHCADNSLRSYLREQPGKVRN